jgi:hypothetical protein
MLLKKIYKTPVGWEKEVDAAGNCTNPPPLDYISLAHTGVQAEQNFCTDMVVDAMRDKYLSIEDDVLILHVAPEDLRYKILRSPGRYCLHCGEKLPDDEKGTLARLHVATKHPDAISPDRIDPAGYEMLNHFECILESQQHDRFRVTTPAKPPKFHKRQEVAHG